MRKLLASVIIGTVALVSLNTQAATTNLLQTISCTLTVYSVGPTITSHGTTTATVNKSSLNSSALIKAIATDAKITVSSKASLDLVSEVVAESPTITYTTNRSGKITTNTVVTLGRLDSYPAIVDGTTIIPVTSYLSVQSTVAGTQLESTVTNPKGIETSDITYNVESLGVNTSTLAFTASGFETDTLEPVTEFGNSFDLHEVDWSLAGNGTKGTSSTPILINGTVTSSFSGVLVVH